MEKVQQDVDEFHACLLLLMRSQSVPYILQTFARDLDRTTSKSQVKISILILHSQGGRLPRRHRLNRSRLRARLGRIEVDHQFDSPCMRIPLVQGWTRVDERRLSCQPVGKGISKE